MSELVGASLVKTALLTILPKVSLACANKHTLARPASWEVEPTHPSSFFTEQY